MDIRKKIFSIVGVLTLTMSMTAGVVSAQETPPVTFGDSKPITIVINCGAANAGTGSLVLSAAGGAESVAFEDFDPSAPATVATDENAFRVDLNLGNCPGTTWSVTAGVTNFSTGETPPVSSISGTHFQLPFSDSTSWMANETTPALNVIGPSGLVTFAESGSTNTGSQPLARPNGTASGSMYLEFGAEMVGLDGNVVDGAYEAEFTVTFNPSAP